MGGIENQSVERKVIAIMRILSQSREPLGARIISHRLTEYGINLTERAVRYHLKILDGRGLTQLVGRDGRLITERGLEELGSAMVQDKVGMAISKIENLAFKTDFDWKTCTGSVPVNVSLYPTGKFRKALAIMAPVFKAGLSAGDLVAVAGEGKVLGDVTVPKGMTGLATVCSVVVNGALLKAGVPIDSRFGGILQMRDNEPFRFVELIHYAGSSLDPSEVFIRGKMTEVESAAEGGNGKILANFRDIPSICRPIVEEVIEYLNQAGLNALLLMGNTSEAVCEIPIDLNRVGIILIGGMNPIAAAEEAGIKAENHAMSTVIDYQSLVKFEGLLR